MRWLFFFVRINNFSPEQASWTWSVEWQNTTLTPMCTRNQDWGRWCPRIHGRGCDWCILGFTRGFGSWNMLKNCYIMSIIRVIIIVLHRANSPIIQGQRQWNICHKRKKRNISATYRNFYVLFDHNISYSKTRRASNGNIPNSKNTWMPLVLEPNTHQYPSLLLSKIIYIASFLSLSN
jgi:hypothetical protein